MRRIVCGFCLGMCLFTALSIDGLRVEASKKPMRIDTIELADGTRVVGMVLARIGEARALGIDTRPVARSVSDFLYLWRKGTVSTPAMRQAILNLIEIIRRQEAAALTGADHTIIMSEWLDYIDEINQVFMCRHGYSSI